MDYEATYNSIEETRGTKQKRQELNLMNENSKSHELTGMMTLYHTSGVDDPLP